MNRTQKFALNSVTAMLSRVVILIAGMITPRLIIGIYGSEINGLVSSLHQFISYITLVEAGIGGAAIYSLYKPLADSDRGKISSVVVAARKSYRQAGYLFSLGILILAFAYSFFNQSETVSRFTIICLTFLFGASECINFFFVAGERVLLTADQKNYIITLATIVITIAKIVLTVVLSWLKVDVVLLYAAVSATSLISIAFIFSYTHKNYSYIDKTAKPDMTSMEKRWDVIYQQIFTMIQSGAPTVIATILFDFVTVSIYSVYNMIISGLYGILNIFTSGLPAGFGELIARNETKNLQKSVSEFEVAYYYILSISYGLALTLILPFIKIYTTGFTDANYVQPALGIMVVLSGFFYNIKTPQSMLVISAGMYRETRWRVTIQGLIIVVFGFLFGMKYKVVGILFASCLSNLYRTIDLLFFVSKRITHNSILRTVLRMVLVVFNILLIYAPVFYFDINVSGFTQWIFIALIWTVYSTIVVTLTTFIFERKAFKALMERMLNLLKLEKV